MGYSSEVKHLPSIRKGLVSISSTERRKEGIMKGENKETCMFVTNHDDVQAKVKANKEFAFLNSIPSSRALMGRDGPLGK